jgi:hypothetical protein
MCSRQIRTSFRIQWGASSHAHSRMYRLERRTRNVANVDRHHEVGLCKFPVTGLGEHGFLERRLGSTPGWLQGLLDLIPAVNLLMQSESGRQSCLEVDSFSGDGVLKVQILGMQEIPSIAGQAGEIFKRLAG